MLDLLPFFQYINTMRGEMTIGDRRKCFFFNVFDERENEAGSCRVINGRWTQRSSLTFSLTFLSSDVLKQSQPHPHSPFCPFASLFLANLPDIHLESLWSFNGNMELCSASLVYALVSHLASNFQSWILTGGDDAGTIKCYDVEIQTTSLLLIVICFDVFVYRQMFKGAFHLFYTWRAGYQSLGVIFTAWSLKNKQTNKKPSDIMKKSRRVQNRGSCL